MVWSIFQYENSFITTTREEINGVPCLKFKPKEHKGPLPTVIYYHGWHSSKEFKKFQSMVIASFGYQVIVPDALHHGERDAVDHDNPQNLEKYIWEIILQSVKESEKFIESIVNDHEAEPGRIGVMGSSMGAITAGGVFALNPDLKCLVGFNGTFAWQEAIKRTHMPTSPNNKELIEFYDPMNNGDKIKERAISILHGIEDTSVPIETQRLFFNKMRPLYVGKPKNLEMIEYSDVNHKVTTKMMEGAVTWFKKHL